MAIEAIRERESMEELSSRLDVNPSLISKWKKEFRSLVAEIFDFPSLGEDNNAELGKPYVKIGQLSGGEEVTKKTS